MPPQFVLSITAGLPSGCAKPDAYDVRRVGTTVHVQVTNKVLTGDIACTMIYGMYELSIQLGSDFDQGVEYTVIVNDKTLKLSW
jgi:hypothetical protein